MTAPEVESLKNDGNAKFKEGDYKEALSLYSQALKLDPEDKTIKANLYKNRAAVHLKKEDYANAERDCSAALELVPNDAKALFRRCQAREQLGNVGDAFKDAKLALHYEPKNQTLIQAMQRLVIANQTKKEALSTENRVKQMLQYAFDPSTQPDKRVQAMNNLVVLAREPVGGALIWQSGAVSKLLNLIGEKGQDENVVLAAQRVLDELAKDENRALSLLDVIGHRNMVRLMNRPGEQGVVDAASLLVQRVVNALAGMDRIQNRKPDPELCERNKLTILKIALELEDMLIDPEVCAIAREAAIDLISKNLIHMDGGLPRGWSWKFVEGRGLQLLLRVACNIPEQHKLPVTAETREHLAVCLGRLYDDMVFDNKRAMYDEACVKYISGKLEQLSGDKSVCVQLGACLTTLLIGVFDVGVKVIANAPPLTNMMLEMAASDDILHQSVAAELIVHTASKRERASAIIASGIPVLKKLYESKNDNIRSRALVGLCKLASSGGTDATRRAMQEGSTIKLAEACRKFLLSGTKDLDVRKWAAEGLSYLTLDAEVKEWLVHDVDMIRSLVTLAKQAGPLVVFGVASIFVNLTNTYEKPKADPEMVKLAQFAKHHVPEDHPKDAPEYVDDRVEILVAEGAAGACVALGNTTSVQSRELLSRALSSFCKKPEHRGTVVKEGGAKMLVSLALEGSELGREYAAQGLARIGASMDPAIAFPGQRMYECVRPILQLLHIEKSGLQNYEALLALTNLTSVSDSVRKRLVKEKALPKIEEYWYMQDHEQLRAAAAELIMNLLHTEEFMEKTIAPGTDRLKLWVLYVGEEDDDRLNSAALAAVYLCTKHKDACFRITKELESWLTIFKEALMRPHPDNHYRTLLCLQNMIEADYEIAAKIFQSDIFELLIAITKMDDPERVRSQKLAGECLRKAEEYEIVKATDREMFERKQKTVTVPADERKVNISTIQEENEDKSVFFDEAPQP